MEVDRAAVPERAVESVTRTLHNIRELEKHLVSCLQLASDPDVVEELPPLQRAQVFLTLAQSVTALYTAALRCNGISPGRNANSEIERMQLYQEKFNRYKDWNKAPLKPSTTINYQAATRFIEHSLPDLTPDQRKSMREISRGEGRKNSAILKYGSCKKRKHQQYEGKSIQTAALEFLEKAAREIVGPSNGKLKGPLQFEASSEEEEAEGDAT